jgi:uncharacterized damage-inducible protein DinB
MNHTEKMAEQIEFTAKNIAHNLDFISDDKLNWNPAETASSVLEIINHIGGNMQGLSGVINTGQWDSSYTPATTKDEAKKVVAEKFAEFAAYVRGVQPQDLQGELVLPFGPFPVSQTIDIAVFDVIHHHGQIAYIQTLLGDTETHLDI